MKKLCFLLILALLLSLGASAFADSSVELIYMDGIPVVVESPSLTAGESNAFDAGAGFTLPAALAAIGEEAFAGIEAERFAAASGFDFVDLNAGEVPGDQPAGQMEAPVVLPFVKK